MTRTGSECAGDRTGAARHGVTMGNIPIIILAAGASRRMGGEDKLMRPVDGVPLLRRVADRAARVGPVLVALPPAPHPRHGALAGTDVTPVIVEDAAEGMNASLRCAVAALPDTAAAAMVLLADMPDLTEDDMRTVLQEVDPDGEMLIWRGTTESGAPGHPVIFDRTLFPALLALRGDGGAQSVVRDNAARTALIPLPGQNARCDLDTAQDWNRWAANR